MIEELAKWKADLLQKNAFLMESNKRNLQLISKIREMQIDILKNLKFLANLKHLNLPSSDIISLCSESLNITQQMVLHSEHSGVPGNLKLNDLDVLTDIEKFAIKVKRYFQIKFIHMRLHSILLIYTCIIGIKKYKSTINSN